MQIHRGSFEGDLDGVGKGWQTILKIEFCCRRMSESALTGTILIDQAGYVSFKQLADDLIEYCPYCGAFIRNRPDAHDQLEAHKKEHPEHFK